MIQAHLNDRHAEVALGIEGCRRAVGWTVDGGEADIEYAHR